jgi:hypothetical protein
LQLLAQALLAQLLLVASCFLFPLSLLHAPHPPMRVRAPDMPDLAGGRDVGVRLLQPFLVALASVPFNPFAAGVGYTRLRYPLRSVE